MKSPPPPRKDIAGQVFGKLTALEFASERGAARTKWRCRCECGNEHVADVSKLICGNTTSCGCGRREASRTRAYVNLAGRRGEASGRWNPDLTAEDRKDRRGPDFVAWSKAILKRDAYTCQACQASSVVLNAHHLRSYRLHPALRFDLTNGITVCVPCHRDYHSAVGQTDFSAESFFEHVRQMAAHRNVEKCA